MTSIRCQHMNLAVACSNGFPEQAVDLACGSTAAIDGKAQGRYLRSLPRTDCQARTVVDVPQTAMVPGAGSRATKSRPNAWRRAISSVAMATKSSVSATING